MLSDCEFCSVVSQNNGEDPIGSATPHQCFLIIETPLPWPQPIWLEPDPMPSEVVDLAADKQIPFRPLAIAPEREWQFPGYRRVFCFWQPTPPFSQFEKEEYLVPNNLVGKLAVALLQDRSQLPQFAAYRQQNYHLRELLVCTHGNVDAACARFGYPIYRKLKNNYSQYPIRAWRVSHFSGHEFAPTLIDLPTGQYWGHLASEVLPSLVKHEGDITALSRCYRGWAGLTKFEQIAEREIWIREGWQWLNYQKKGQVLNQDQNYEHWAKVRIDYISPQGKAGAYEASLEVKDKVTTMMQSGNHQSLTQRNQYEVTYLEKVLL
ncbi:MAG: sucrase ferredoxin [Cyanobacteria bacterium]|jgi:hypothetical protein|nr:sucrase ferredoxin [Cyanobacteria bacterium GSL.Bin1]